jgi:hypothetical protein
MDEKYHPMKQTKQDNLELSSKLRSLLSMSPPAQMKTRDNSLQKSRYKDPDLYSIASSTQKHAVMSKFISKLNNSVKVSQRCELTDNI